MISDTCEGILADNYDVCVIGSGPVGLTVALELGRQNKRVLVLESGVNRADFHIQSLSAAELVDPSIHDDPIIASSRRLGGTSNLWGARCQPFDPIDFLDRPQLRESRWPIPYQELCKFYDRACAYAGCGDYVFSDTSHSLIANDDRIDFERLERFSNRPAFQIAHADELARSDHIDIRLNSTVVDIRLSENGRAEAVTVCRPDGIRHELPVKTLVLAMGGNESTRLMLALQAERADLFGGPDGPLGRYYMGHLIGEVADVTFSSGALDRAFDFYLDGHGSYARRRMVPSDLMQLNFNLPNVSFWPVVPPANDPSHGSGILSMVVLALSIGPVGRLLVAEVIRKFHAPDGMKRLPHILNVLGDLPSAVGYAPSFLYRRYLAKYRLPGFFMRNPARRYGLSYHAEQAPSRSSRMWLGADRDRLGLRKLAIDLRFQRADAEGLARAHALLDGWLRRTGFGELSYRQPEPETASAILAGAVHGTHQIGTIRMGCDRRSAVVDETLRSFDVENLYVASSAVFPTSGQANPTLTAVALAVRLADHLAAQA